MDNSEMELAANDAVSERSIVLSVPETQPQMEMPSTPKRTTDSQNGAAKDAGTPQKTSPSKVLITGPPMSPRFRKKVPWKGKNILIQLPRDDQRGKPGEPPFPLNTTEVSRMFGSWEELGYSVRGFDLQGDVYSQTYGIDDHSLSRDAWPVLEEMSRERSERNYKVMLPDLNGKCSHEL